MSGRARGFTLLEVLVALAVLALSAAAVMRQAEQSVRQQQTLELKSYALWLADDQLAALAINSPWPPLGRMQRDVSFSGRDWRITTEVQATPDPDLRRVNIGVALADAPEGSTVATFDTFRGRR